MAGEIIDSTARAKAEKAMTIAELAREDINGHKSHCAERWEISRGAMSKVEDKIDRVDARHRAGWRWIVGLIIAGQGTALVLLLTLLTRGAP